MSFWLLIIAVIYFSSRISTCDYSLFIVQALNLILALIVTVQVIFYGRKSKEKLKYATNYGGVLVDEG